MPEVGHLNIWAFINARNTLPEIVFYKKITKSNQKSHKNPKWVYPIFQQNTCKIP
jgi:hypothetical protein